MANNSEPSSMQSLTGWVEIVYRDGRRCYCNSSTGESSWTKPSGVQSFAPYSGNKNLPEWVEIVYRDGRSSSKYQPKSFSHEGVSPYLRCGKKKWCINKCFRDLKMSIYNLLSLLCTNTSNFILYT